MVGSWSAELCQTQVVEDEDDGNRSTVKCLCKSLTPTTVVDDLKGLFTDSKV